MSERLQLIYQKLEHLEKMQEYLNYSAKRSNSIVPVEDWSVINEEQHESLAAFRVRFSEYQEHLGKTMRAIAQEEEVDTAVFSAVLTYMEKLNIIISAERWKVIRELRNAINHEYENDTQVLNQFFSELLKATPELFAAHQNLINFCKNTYKNIAC